ncbi:MAG: 6-carboxytetrahydropterin synthase [Planctomycetes bacterium]|nr:6-carboxytetrahydropterin synthase [Planctomycetota bacterium]
MKVGIVEHIDSMHRLPGHPKCGVPHGHTYRIEITVEGPVVGGMVIDFDALKAQVRELLKPFDHADLNRLIDYPSCENISVEILRRLRERLAGDRLTVRVWEGEGKWAEMEG